MQPEAKRDLLRHTVATLAYRAAKALRGADGTFPDFRPSPDSRSPAELLAHMGDLFDWALSVANGAENWHASAQLPWEQETARFFRTLAAFDARLAAPAPLAVSEEVLFQGPIADALTHTGQMMSLRRMAGQPARSENYSRARIAAGQIGADQPHPAREF